jgi:pseudolysin
VSKKNFIISVLISLITALALPAQAAIPVSLQESGSTGLQSVVAAGSTMQELSRHTDANGTTHIRVQQNYLGVPVWGADAVVHVPRAHAALALAALAGTNAAGVTMNGTLYQGLEKDLVNASRNSLSAGLTQKALAQAVLTYQQQADSNAPIKKSHVSKLIYVDEKNLAHWAYQVSFLVAPPHVVPLKPTYIMDAETFVIYVSWNNIQTGYATEGGGFGGNKKTGMLVYDGLPSDLPKLKIRRDTSNQMCLLMNDDVRVKNAIRNDSVIQFVCKKEADDHDHVYWDAAQDAVHGGFSPANDALYVGSVIKALYQDWYGVPVLVRNGKPMMLNMRVHEDMDNAFWDGSEMTFGDGISYFYPLVSLGVGAHEISHGFTEQHSGLDYMGMSGGLNESFSDMAAQAAEYYSNGVNTWQIGAEIIKAPNTALRYMDDPTKDCAGRHPGKKCSIDNIKDYNRDLDVHFSSGIFNKIFYLLATTPDWNTRKAFDVMVKANMDYWTQETSFTAAACGVLAATKDLRYSVTAVTAAIAKVGINTSKCR